MNPKLKAAAEAARRNKYPCRYSIETKSGNNLYCEPNALCDHCEDGERFLAGVEWLYAHLQSQSGGLNSIQLLTDARKYIDDYVDMGHFAKPNEATPYLIDGFQHGARWQHAQDMALVGALRAERDDYYDKFRQSFDVETKELHKELTRLKAAWSEDIDEAHGTIKDLQAEVTDCRLEMGRRHTIIKQLKVELKAAQDLAHITDETSYRAKAKRWQDELAELRAERERLEDLLHAVHDTTLEQDTKSRIANNMDASPNGWRSRKSDRDALVKEGK